MKEKTKKYLCTIEYENNKVEDVIIHMPLEFNPSKHIYGFNDKYDDEYNIKIDENRAIYCMGWNTIQIISFKPRMYLWNIFGKFKLIKKARK